MVTQKEKNRIEIRFFYKQNIVVNFCIGKNECETEVSKSVSRKGIKEFKVPSERNLKNSFLLFKKKINFQN